MVKNVKNNEKMFCENKYFLIYNGLAFVIYWFLQTDRD
jgi:hypothetical protein